MKIGIYGGSFDPIHHGHLLLARDVRERHRLDRLFLVPAARSPHKPSWPRANAAHRLAMARLAVRGEPAIEVSPAEIRRGGPSYAIDTVATFQGRFPSARLFWILGADQRARLPEWHRFDELRRHVTFLFMERAGAGAAADAAPHGRTLDISSSEIRARIRRGRSIRFLLPDSVIAYIRRHRLYLDSPSR